MMKKGDLIIALVILLIMVALGIGYFIYRNSLGNQLYVNIYIDNELYKSIELNNDTDEKITIDNKYGVNIIHIHDNGFEVIYADCLNQVDVRQGFVKMPGYSVICAPHHLRIIIEGNKMDGPDAYA